MGRTSKANARVYQSSVCPETLIAYLLLQAVAGRTGAITS